MFRCIYNVLPILVNCITPFYYFSLITPLSITYFAYLSLLFSVVPVLDATGRKNVNKHGTVGLDKDEVEDLDNLMDENGILWDDMDTLPDVSDAELDRVLLKNFYTRQKIPHHFSIYSASIYFDTLLNHLFYTFSVALELMLFKNLNS